MNIIDLFSGCGGMSLGFEMAGLPTIVANEIDEWAGDTFEKNHPNTKLFRGDIRDIKDWGVLVPAKIRGKIDGVIGGPPCQGFSLSGNRDAHRGLQCLAAASELICRQCFSLKSHSV